MSNERGARTEREAARELSARVDRLLAGEPHPAGDPFMPIAHRLGRLGDALPPVPKALELRVGRMIASALVPPMTAWQRVRPALWGALTATVLLLLLWTVTPGGQTAWAQMLHALPLGQTRVELTPTIDAEQTRAVREPLRDLLAAELLMGRAPALPKALPEGHVLREITAVSFPDLPDWISQPLYVELAYGVQDRPPTFLLRQYRLLFKDYGGILSMTFPEDRTIEQVDVAGVNGALLTMAGDPPRFVIVWERDGLLLELQSAALSREELLQIAQTVR